MNLTQLGFSPFFEQQLQTLSTDGRIVGRVILEHKHSYRIGTEQGDLLATVSGNFAYNAFQRADYPAVGDFVLVSQMPGEQRAIIHHLFERQSKFTRKMAGSELDEQIVATNVTTVFLVMSLNADFNIRRLERYLVAAWDSGATPVIVLTKADLCLNTRHYVSQVEAVAFGVDIVVVSAVADVGIDVLKSYITEGKTAALLGSSGAGKSTIVNALLGTNRMVVSGIREDDAKGRHTTTYRELVLLPEGGCIIDTPGMRELQMWDQEDSLQAAFQDIETLAENCHYRDCKHRKEPHCAIKAAVANGTLASSRLTSYFKLQRELAYVERKVNIQERLVNKQKNKKVTKHK